MRKKQTGASMFVVVFILVTCVFFVILGFKSVPIVNEYLGIKKVVSQIQKEGANLSISEMKESFTTKAKFEYITVVKADDLVITKDGSNVTISVIYDAPVRLFGSNDATHLDLMFHFDINEGQKLSKDSSTE